MKEQKKEKIAILIVLLFILSYLITWNYDVLIREPREVKDKEELEVYEMGEESGELILDKSASDGYITIGGYSDAITIGVISTEEEGIVGWGFEPDIYKLPWIWQDLDYDQTVIIMSNEVAQKLHIAEEFMEWLYRNDYEIAKKESQ